MKEFKVGDAVTVPARIEAVGHALCDLECEGQMLRIAASRLSEIEEEKAKEKTYEDGLNDAWEAANKIFCDENHNGLPIEAIKDIFDECSVADIVSSISAQDAIDKIKAWEDVHQIRVNDEVLVNPIGRYAVVIHVDDDTDTVKTIFKDTGQGTYLKSSLVKTGRTIDIAGLLAEIRDAK